MHYATELNVITPYIEALEPEWNRLKPSLNLELVRHSSQRFPNSSNVQTAIQQLVKIEWLQIEA